MARKRGACAGKIIINGQCLIINLPYSRFFNLVTTNKKPKIKNYGLPTMGYGR